MLPIESVSRFLDEVRAVKQDSLEQGEKSDLIFRGQKAKYQLLPSLLRYKEKDKNKLEQLEKLSLVELKRASPPLVDIIPDDDFDWVVLAQHFGLPTRLLDWTYNPLAALWFAVSEFKNRRGNDQDEGSVWIFNPTLEDYRKQQNITDTIVDIQENIVYRPRNLTSRVSNQSSVFTLHILDREKHLEIDPNFKGKFYWHKIKIGCEEAILEELHYLNVNEATIFPDLGGLCNHLKWRYFERK